MKFKVTFKSFKTYNYFKSIYMESGVILLFDFFIIGEDLRLISLANLFDYKDFNVLVYETDCEKLNKKIKQTNSIKFALKNSKNIICPIPFTKDNVFLNIKNKKIYIKNILKHISHKNRMFGGCFPKEIIKICEEKGIFVYDYMKNKKFIVYNSISTAEAAIARAVLKNPINMHDSNCLVLGFGNCGKLICNKLKGFCSKIYVSSNDVTERIWAKAFGYYFLGLDSLRLKLEKFDYVFNTIPKKIFDDDMLNCLKKNVYILDLTNVGFNKKDCLKRSIHFEYIAGIPGLYKHLSSSKILADLILKIINKF